MYLGSVKFFRHLILTGIALMIIIPLAAAVIATVRNNVLEKEINKLKETVSAYGEFNEREELSSADFYALMERLGIKKEEFFALLYEKNPYILSVLDNYTNEQAPDKAPEDRKAKPSPKTPGGAMLRESAPPDTRIPVRESSSEYTGLYLDLYVEDYAYEAGRRYWDDKGYIYLTFDDGPSKHTLLILNYLRMHNVPATFFVIPNENSSLLLNTILKNGHVIGVHSASHNYQEIYSSVEAFLADFKKAYDLIYKQTGIKPEIFRFPGGSKNGSYHEIKKEIVMEMTRRGFVYFDWNVDSRDYADADWTQMYNTVLNEVAENTARGHRSIVLMHDRPGGMNTVLVVEDIIVELLKNPMYKFGKLDRSVKPIQF